MVNARSTARSLKISLSGVDAACTVSAVSLIAASQRVLIAAMYLLRLANKCWQTICSSYVRCLSSLSVVSQFKKLHITGQSLADLFQGVHSTAPPWVGQCPAQQTSQGEA